MTSPAAVIQKKRDGKELTFAEISWFVEGLLSGDVADYQATALLMAIFFRGLSLNETIALTRAMADSGECYDLSFLPGPKIDKHSTGGVGDKVSLILTPLAAACGIVVPMMSGRGLGHTGGTLDKLESISGFNTSLSRSQFENILKQISCAMIGQSESIAPADRKLYALRDVTGTVENIALITASILSKKIAEGTKGLVLDVKCGSGAFMKTRARALQLGRCLKTVGRKLGLSCEVVISSMDQPLGYAIGNSLEVIESIEILKGQQNPRVSSADLTELTLHLCGLMLIMAKKARSIGEGVRLARERLNDQSAWRVFKKMVELQGGNVAQIEDTSLLPLAPVRVPLVAAKKGFVSRIDTEWVGRTLIELGGGRTKASDTIDPGVGFVFHKKIGAPIAKGETIAIVYARHNSNLQALEKAFFRHVLICPNRKNPPKLVLDSKIK